MTLPGNNTLLLNQATVIQAVQHYFESVLFAPGMAPKITSIAHRSDRGSDVFAVEVEERDPLAGVDQAYLLSMRGRRSDTMGEVAK